MPTELFSVVSKFREEFGPPDESLDLANMGRVGFDNRPPSALGLLPALLRPGTPIGLPRRDRAMVQRALARFMSGRYDLVWFFGPRPWVLAGKPVFAPTVLDLIDLEDEKILARLSAPGPPAPGPFGRVRRAGAAVVSGGRGPSLAPTAPAQQPATSAPWWCAARWMPSAPRPPGSEHLEVIPNGYPAVAHPVGRIAVGSPPTVLFQGLLRYPPNIDAARWLATGMGPALRTLVPDAEIRLVGEHPPELSSLDDRPRVTVTGRVPGHRHRAGPGRRRGGAGPLRQWHQAQDPRGLRPAGAGGVDPARRRGDRRRGRCPSPAGGHRRRTWPRRVPACCGQPDLREALVSRAHRLFLERFQSDVIEQEWPGWPARWPAARAGEAVRPALIRPRSGDGRASLT